MINAYQAKQTASKKSWVALTNHVERKVMGAISFGDYSCRVNTANTNATELARLIIELAKDRYSIEVKPFKNNSWQLYISWDNPNEGFTIGPSGKHYTPIKINEGLETDSNRVEELESAIISLVPDAIFEPE